MENIFIFIGEKIKNLKDGLYKCRLNYFKTESLGKDFIYSVIIKMDECCRRYNGKYVGRGIDPYCKFKILDYPLAYAIYIRGFLEIYRFTKNESWLENAIKASEILDKIRLRESKMWGLPFPWRGIKNEPYLITTAIVGHSFMELYEITKEKKYLKEVQNIINWIINTLGYSKGEDGICFWFSPNIRKHVLNSSAQATSLIARYLHFNRKKNGLDGLLKDSLNYIQSKQLSNYLWDYYGEDEKPKKIIDFHNNYVIESNYILNKYYNLERIQVKNMMVQPFISLSHNLLNMNGSLREKTIKLAEARLWAYGAFLYTGLNVVEVTEIKQEMLELKKCLKLLLTYIFSNLYLSKEGTFKYKINDSESKYIRHTAHMFYGLARLLNSRGFWN